MKLQTTKKQIKANFYTILSVGYCEAQYLLYYKNPFAYSAGVYGWACDYYEFGNTCISTGYSPIGEKVEYNLLQELEKQARDIVNSLEINYKEKPAQIDLLLTQLINSVK